MTLRFILFEQHKLQCVLKIFRLSLVCVVLLSFDILLFKDLKKKRFLFPLCINICGVIINIPVKMSELNYPYVKPETGYKTY